MYKLHWAENTGAFAPHAALAEAGADHELVEVDLDANAHHTPEFLAVNPRAQVPVLTLPDGTVMTESAAMMMCIADSHPESGLLPKLGAIERAAAYRWLLFGSVNLYEAGCRIHDTHHYSVHESDYNGIREKARIDLDQFWQIIGEALGAGPFMLGREFSAVDIYLLMLAQWHPNQAGLLERFPSLRVLCDLVRNRPAIKAIWAQNFPD